MSRTLTPEHRAKLAEGLARWKAENAEQPTPKPKPGERKLGDKATEERAKARLAATGVERGDTIEITRGKHKGERHVVKSLTPSEAEVFDGRRYWSAYVQPPYFRVVKKA